MTDLIQYERWLKYISLFEDYEPAGPAAESARAALRGEPCPDKYLESYEPDHTTPPYSEH